MKKLIPMIVFCTAITSTIGHAQTALDPDGQTLDAQAAETGAEGLSGIIEAEILPLSEVIEAMSDADILQMEEAANEVGTLTIDLEQAIESAVEDAVATGAVAPEMSADAAATLEIVNANAEFFDFDILDEIATVIAEGEFTEAQIRQTLEGFNQLSDADKALVGQESFEADEANALYAQVSAAGKAIIASSMPVLTIDDDDDDVDDVLPPPGG